MSPVAKRRFVRIAILGAAIVGAGALVTKAEAADPPPITCPVDSLTAAERAEVDQHIIDEAPNEDPRWQLFLRAVDSCAARYHWSRHFSEYAFHYNFITEAQVATRRFLSEHRVEIGELERLLLADPAVAGAGGVDALTVAVRDFMHRHRAMVARLVQGRPDLAQIAKAIGVFLFARAMQRELDNAPVVD